MLRDLIRVVLVQDKGRSLAGAVSRGRIDPVLDRAGVVWIHEAQNLKLLAQSAGIKIKTKKQQNELKRNESASSPAALCWAFTVPDLEGQTTQTLGNSGLKLKANLGTWYARPL